MSINACIFVWTAPQQHRGGDDLQIARHCLKIPGRVMDLTTLLDKKKFRSFQNKDGALRGFRHLESNDLGTLEVKSGTGNPTVFELPYLLY